MGLKEDLYGQLAAEASRHVTMVMRYGAAGKYAKLTLSDGEQKVKLMSDLTDDERALLALGEAPTAPKKVPLIELLPAYLNGKSARADLPVQFRGWGPLEIVGNRFRGPEAVDVLSSKGGGSMVMVCREPDNAVDPKAMACFVWKSSEKKWVAVGYVRATLAKSLNAQLRNCGAGAVLEGKLLSPGSVVNPTFSLEHLRILSNVPERLLA